MQIKECLNILFINIHMRSYLYFISGHHFQGLFGPTFVNCCYIVITHGNGITKSLADYVRDQAGTPLGQIMNSTLRGRIIAVENSCEGSYFRQGQQKQVLRFIASSTGDAMYTNEDMQQVGHL